MYQDQELVIRPIREEDLPRLWDLIYKEEAPEWKKWDAPYFEHKTMAFEAFMEKSENFVDRDNFWGLK